MGWLDFFYKDEAEEINYLSVADLISQLQEFDLDLPVAVRAGSNINLAFGAILQKNNHKLVDHVLIETDTFKLKRIPLDAKFTKN